MKPTVVRLAAVAVLILAARPGPARDTLSLATGNPKTGSFEAYRNGRFYFVPAGGKQIRETRVRVMSLDLEPAVRVNVKPRGKRDIEDVLLTSYDGKDFVFEQNEKEIRLAGAQVTSVEIGLDFKRFLQHAQEERGPSVDTPQDLSELAQPGKVTVIHLHMDDAIASVRQGQYVRSLANKSRDRLKLVKVTLKSWDSPTAKRHNISSIPQFWFFNRRGVEVTRLTERFTSDDIDAALRAASR